MKAMSDKMKAILLLCGKEKLLEESVSHVILYAAEATATSDGLVADHSRKDD